MDQFTHDHAMEQAYLGLIGRSTNINRHLPALRSLASECSVVVEFGTGRCRSTQALLCGRPLVLHSYDTVVPKELKGLLIHPSTKFLYHQQSTLEIECPPCDLLFIDDLHTYEQVKKELELHHLKVRKYLAFHDTKSYPEVARAVDEFMKAHIESWQMIYDTPMNNGFRILQNLHVPPSSGKSEALEPIHCLLGPKSLASTTPNTLGVP